MADDLRDDIVSELLRDKKADRRLKWGGYALKLAVLAFGGYVFFTIQGNQPDADELTDRLEHIQYATVAGKTPGDTPYTVLVLPIEGEISGTPLNTGTVEASSLLGSRSENVVLKVRRGLEEASKIDHLSDLVLFIDSPGGTITASDEILNMIRAWKMNHPDVTVTGYIYGLGASGGYYVAMGSDRLIASSTALVGNIGVVTQLFNVGELAEKYGVTFETITTGPFKDIGSMFREMTEADRELLQSLADQAYGQFLSVIDVGRPDLSYTEIKALADGRIFSAAEAAENGLIDEVSPSFDIFVKGLAAASSKEHGGASVKIVIPGNARSFLDTLLAPL